MSFLDPRRIALLAHAVALLAPAAGLAQLGTFRARLLTEDTVVLVSRPEAIDWFGAALAVGDFDGDGVDDLATAIPGDNDPLGLQDTGAVVVRYGVAGFGLAPGLVVDDGFLAQWWPGGPDPAEEWDHFGGLLVGNPALFSSWNTLAVGDFDGDFYDDLAVGTPHEDVGTESDAGAVQIHYGSSAGLDHRGAAFFHQNTPGVAGDAEADDRFAYALASSDFDGDGFDDLAIGVPGEDFFGFPPWNKGMLQILYGGAGGIATARARSFDQDAMYDGVPMEGGAEEGDEFGSYLASGDLDGDGYADLAIGVPGEDGEAGAVAVLYGASSGLSTPGNQLLHQETAGIADSSEDDDRFGVVLAIGDFEADGDDDLVVGVPFEDLDVGGGQTAADAGAVHFLFGSPSGLSGPNSYYMTSSATGVGVSEVGDRWGAALAAGDFDADGFADLALGAPGEHVFGDADGEVVIAHGHAPGGPPFLQVWHQNVPGVPDNQEPTDRFGTTLATGDFDGSGHSDLVVGTPFEAIVADDQGAAWVLYGSLFADGFEGGSTANWSAAVP